MEQAARFKADDWEEPIKEWLGDRNDTSIRELLEHVLGLNPQKPNHSAETRVAKILTRRLGFSKHRPRTKGGRENRYWREKLPEQTVTTVPKGTKS